jgi:hypothetical protein
MFESCAGERAESSGFERNGVWEGKGKGRGVMRSELKNEPINEDLDCILRFKDKSQQSLIRLINSSQQSLRYRTLNEKPADFESFDQRRKYKRSASGVLK